MRHARSPRTAPDAPGAAVGNMSRERQQVARVSGTLDPGTRTMLVEIDLPNDDGRIRPVLYGQTQLLAERRERALALPVARVRFDPGGAFVYVGSDVGALDENQPLRIVER